MEVHIAGLHDDLIADSSRNVLVRSLDLLHGQIVGCNGQLRLQQPLIDRAELSNGQRPEVHGSYAFGTYVNERGSQRRSELGISQPEPRERRS